MKSMQRKFGTFGKRSENEQDVGTIMAEFKAADQMLELMLKELKAWRNGWEDILKYQYEVSEAFGNLYRPIEPTADPEMRSQPAQTPAKYSQKCFGLQKEYSDMKTDLAQEINMIDAKLLRPVDEAKKSTKALHKTLKHRENMKLDYERYLGRAEHVRRKDNRTQKEEIALATHENNLAQAQIDYQTADDQVKQTFPPVTAAVIDLIPLLLANMVTLQTTLVGQLYTVLDTYTRRHGLPNPSSDDAEIVAAWEREFTSFRKELEGGIASIANGKAVQKGMALPREKDKSTVTGLGIRNKVMHRGKSDQAIAVRPAGHHASADNSSDMAVEEEEAAPPQPPRPGAAMPSPSINMASKPRVPSGASSNFNQSSINHNSYPSNPPPPYPTSLSPGHLPYPSSNKSGSPSPSAASTGAGTADYFAMRNNPSHASLASSAASLAAAKKKKPPPPVPSKRIPGAPQPHFVTAVYDFDGQSAGDLAFKEGDRIRVVKKTESTDDWWEGELRGRQGSFPANYVAL